MSVWHIHSQGEDKGFSVRKDVLDVIPDLEDDAFEFTLLEHIIDVSGTS